MESKPEMKSKTNPILASILRRYVGVDSVGVDNSNKPGGSDWYNMTCPRCPWFVDGEKRGLYANVRDDSSETDATSGDMADYNDAAPDNAPVAGKRDTGDSGRLNGDDTYVDEEWDELLDGLDAKCGNNEDIMGLDDSRRVPIVRCERPETVECLNDSLCVKLIVAGDLIRQQAAVQRMMDDIESHVPGDNSARRKLTKRAKRSLKLRRASRKRGR